MKEKMGKFIGKYWQIGVVLLLATGFFIGTSACIQNMAGHGAVKWMSPDSNANYIFAKLYGQAGEMSIFEKYGFASEDILHPRSIRSDMGVLKPVSFPGIILIYGTIASFTNYEIIPYLTPFFAALGIIFFYLLLRKIWGVKNAFISTIFLSIFPVYIYYTVRSMFHNVLFTVLLLGGLYFAYLMVEKKKIRIKFFDLAPRSLNWQSLIYASLSAVFLGLAVITRTSELMWILPALFILWVINIKRVGFLNLLFFIAVFLFTLTPQLYWNNILYGSFFSGGYPEMNSSIYDLTESSSALVKGALGRDWHQVPGIAHKIKDVFFYFGLHPRQAFDMFVNYFVVMFSWLFVFASGGLFMIFGFWHRWPRRYWGYISALAVISIILVVYYGSWQFFDNPDKTQFTIGNSYTRYWLPVYLGAMPLASFFLIRFTRGVFPYRAKKARSFFALRAPRPSFPINGVRAVIITIIAVLSLNFVFFGSDEGLSRAIYEREGKVDLFRGVVENTEGNAVIITKYHDKLIFPERKVIYGDLSDPNMIDIYANIIDKMPLYYIDFSLRDKDIKYLNERRLKEYDITIERKGLLNKDFDLYRLK
jgi:hypothetical protein